MDLRRKQIGSSLELSGIAETPGEFALRLGLVLLLALGSASCANGVSQCCKVCPGEQPCGDICISKSETCEETPGCACESY